MSETFDLVICGGTVMLPGGPETTDVGVRDGKIVAFGASLSGRGGEEINAAGLHVLPGVIDSQVHFRRAGQRAQRRLGDRNSGRGLGRGRRDIRDAEYQTVDH